MFGTKQSKFDNEYYSKQFESIPVSNGRCVTLFDQTWTVCLADDGSCTLTNTRVSDDEKQQSEQGVVDYAHQINMRQNEADTLKVMRKASIEAMEQQVHTFLSLLVPCIHIFPDRVLTTTMEQGRIWHISYWLVVFIFERSHV